MPQASGIVGGGIGILFYTRVYAFSLAHFQRLFPTFHYARRTTLSSNRSCFAELREYNRALYRPCSTVPSTPGNRTNV
jgi:hypothetical protein